MSDLGNWVRLAKLEAPRKAVALLEHFGSPEDVLDADVQSLAAVENVSKPEAERIHRMAGEPVDKELAALEKNNIAIITWRDPNYPQNLRTIFDPPVVLFVRGEIHEEDRFAVAIIGTRRPSEYGKSMAMSISRDLAERCLTIVSGGARGIDTVAHWAAVNAGGRTIAVLGCGVDVAYPSENRDLYDKISRNGAVISEYVPGTRPDAWRFPVRNRLISGLSMGVLVVESKLSGGAMITATIAAEHGRDVWAVPGSADSSVSEGPHRLIKEGAKLVESADDILEEMGIEVETPAKQPKAVPDNLTPEQKLILQALDLQPKHVDQIIAECRLTPAAANSSLTLLEMLGLIRRVPGNAYVRAI